MVGKVAGPSCEDTWGQSGAERPQAGRPLPVIPAASADGPCRTGFQVCPDGGGGSTRFVTLPLPTCPGEVLPLPDFQTNTTVMPSARGSALLPVTSVVWFCSEAQHLQLGPHRRRSAHLPQHAQADVWAHTTHTLTWTRIAIAAHRLPARGGGPGWAGAGRWA